MSSDSRPDFRELKGFTALHRIMSERSTSPVQQWVTSLQETGNDLHRQIGENFQYYLDHVDELEDGTLDFQDLPNLGGPEKVAMHASVMFGLSWAKEASLHIVLDDEAYVETFGIEENAERFAATSEGHRVSETIPTGEDPEADIAAMKEGDSEKLPQVGENIEHLYENEAGFHSDTPTDVIDAMPHFSENIKYMIAFSTLFGQVWEFTDPALWAVLGEDDAFDGLYCNARQAAKAAQASPSHTVEPVTPRDNARHAEAASMNPDFLQ